MIRLTGWVGEDEASVPSLVLDFEPGVSGTDLGVLIEEFVNEHDGQPVLLKVEVTP